MNLIKPEFLQKLLLYQKKCFGHVSGCGAGVFGDIGCVNQCGTKGKVYGCKLNLPTKAILTFLVIIIGYPAPQNPWRFGTVLNASQTPECLYVPECLRMGPLFRLTLKQLQLFLPFFHAHSTHDTLVSQ